MVTLRRVARPLESSHCFVAEPTATSMRSTSWYTSRLPALASVREMSSSSCTLDLRFSSFKASILVLRSSATAFSCLFFSVRLMNFSTTCDARERVRAERRS
jgi:hypothetical protein